MELLLRYRLLFFLFFLVLNFTSQEVGAKTETQLTEIEVTELLRKIEVQFLLTTTLATKFQQEKQISFFEGKMISTGALLFKSPGKVRMDSFSPFKTSAIVNGNNAVLYEFMDETWKKLDNSENGMVQAVMKNIISWLQGKFNDSSLYGVAGVRKNGLTYLTLTPKSVAYQKHIHHFELGINKAVNGLDSILIMLPDGDYTLYKFYNDRINNDLSEEIFDTQKKEPSFLPLWLNPIP